MNYMNFDFAAKFPFAGQNIAIMQTTNKYADDRDAIQNLVTDWYDEYKWTDPSVIDSYQLPTNP